jgi:hypothetical protein
MPEPDAIAAFAARYGCSEAELRGDGYRIEGADAGFDGRVSRLRVTEYGRFGNIVYQILNAALVARRIGCTEIEIFPFACGPAFAKAEIGGLRFIRQPPDPAAAASGPGLAGDFFNSAPFGRLLPDIPARVVWATVRRVLVPLFADIRARAAALPAATQVMHFRSGDIFAQMPPHQNYVQPPASFYLLAADHARARLGIREVILMFEDRGNPAINVVEAGLRQRGIPFRTQSSAFEDDLALLLGAVHLVASYSTLVEAVAILSDRLNSYFAFRHLESHYFKHDRRDPLLDGVLRRKRIRTFLVADKGGYVPERAWEGSDAQLALLRNYPAERLTIASRRHRIARWFYAAFSRNHR